MRPEASDDHHVVVRNAPAEVHSTSELEKDAECCPKWMENSKSDFNVQGARLSESVDNLLQWGRDQLHDLGSREALLSIEQLLGFVLGQDRVSLYLERHKVVTQEEEKQFRSLVDQRKHRVPLAHLTRKQSFWEEELEVGPECLIPRPETEVLVEKLLENLGSQNKKVISFLDLGTGSGAIGIALLRACSLARGTFSDVSKDALKMAQKNVDRYQLNDRAQLVYSDLFSQLEKNKWDVIVSNPPYFAKEDWNQVEPEVLRDPSIALDGGEDGLEFYRKITCEARQYLKPEGLLAFEVGHGQANDVSELLKKYHYHSILIYPDYSGIDRVVIATVGH